MSTVAFAKRQSRVIHGPSLSPERAPSLRAGYFGDLHVYDPAAMAWTNLSAAASGTPPSPRAYHGFTSAGGLLYVHGGFFADLNSAGGESRPVLPAGVLQH